MPPGYCTILRVKPFAFENSRIEPPRHRSPVLRSSGPYERLMFWIEYVGGIAVSMFGVRDPYFPPCQLRSWFLHAGEASIISRRNARCSSRSTPSATARSFSVRAMAMMAVTMPAVSLSSVMSRTND